MHSLRNFRVTLLVAVFALLGFAAKAQNHLMETHTSPDGKYTYNTVTGDPLKARIYKLANGLTIYLTVNKAEPRIYTNIAVRAGSKNDPSDATGLAHYLEHMLFKGTDQYGSLDYSKEKPLLDQIEQLYETYRKTTDDAERKRIYHTIDSISGVAANYAIANEYDKMLATLGATGTNAYTSFEQTVYVNDIPANQLERWLMVEGERFRNPVLRLFHTELEAVYEEKNISLDNDGREAFTQLFEGLFPTHNYGQQTTIGTVEHLKNPSITRIKEYFERYYVPNNMAICLSGDLDPDKTIELIDKYFGSYQSKPLRLYVPPVESPITAPVVKEVTGPDAEDIRIGFRFPGSSSREALLVTLLDNVLANGTSGLIDLNLVKSQKVLSAGSFAYVLKDYTAHILTGKPREGQTLEDIQKLLLEQLDKIKKGEFDEQMLTAIVNNFEIDKMEAYQENNARAGDFVEAFTTGYEWTTFVSMIDEMRKITKQELVDFANKNYKDNYVVVFKRTGPRRDVKKVTKPEITPVEVNRESQSPFLQKVNGMPASTTNPVFLDYTRDLRIMKMGNGIPVHIVKNTENTLFTQYYIFDMGRVNDKKMDIAIRYLRYLGTDQYSADQIATMFYNLGSTFDVSSSHDQIYVYVSGLEKNYAETVKLFEHLLLNAKADDKALPSMIDGILKGRANAKLNKGLIFRQMQMYAQFEGDVNPHNDVLSEAELRALTPQELVDRIHSLTSYQHRVLYYGPSDEVTLIALLDKLHITPAKLNPVPQAKVYRFRQNAANTLFFVNYDMVQAEILWQMKPFDGYNPAMTPTIALYNEYFGGGMSGVVFQTIRESKALAYSTYSVFAAPAKKSDPNFVFSYVGTQADKIHESIGAMQELLNKIPESEVLFSNAKTGLKSQYETERIIRTDILFNYENAMKRGLNYDIRRDVYMKAPALTWQQILDFHKANIAAKKYTMMVLGSKDKIDLKSLEKYGKVVELSLEKIFGY